MKIENRLVYIAEDGEEFDNEAGCQEYESALRLTNLFDKAYVGGSFEYAEFVVYNFDKVKEIVEGKA